MSVAPLPGPAGERPADPVSVGADVPAFEAFFRRQQRRLAAFLASQVVDRDLVDDLVQEVFLRAYRRGLHRETAGDPWPWLVTVARNLAADVARRGSTGDQVPIDDPEALPAGEEIPTTAAASSEQPWFLETLHSVSARHARMLIARYAYGLGYHDIAAREGMSVVAVRSALFRARRAFRRRYEDLARGRGFGALAPGIALWGSGLRRVVSRLRSGSWVPRALEALAPAGVPAVSAGMVAGTLAAMAVSFLPYTPVSMASGAAAPAGVEVAAPTRAETSPMVAEVDTALTSTPSATTPSEQAGVLDWSSEAPPEASRVRVDEEIRTQGVAPPASPAQSSATADSGGDGTSLRSDRELDVDGDGVADDDGRLLAGMDCRSGQRRVVTGALCPMTDEASGLAAGS